MVGQLNGLLLSTAVGVASDAAGYSTWDFWDLFHNPKFALHQERILADPALAKLKHTDPTNLFGALSLGSAKKHETKESFVQEVKTTLSTDLQPKADGLCGLLANVRAPPTSSYQGAPGTSEAARTTVYRDHVGCPR